MKTLDKTKEYYLGNLNKEQRGVLYDYLLSVDDTYKNTKKTYFEHICDGYISFKKGIWHWTIDKQTHTTTDALTLFEPQFKQGDKVLVRDCDEDEWLIRLYATEYNGEHYVESKHSNNLSRYVYIKPYEDEIKVGDWYLEISNNAIRKATNVISENYLKNKNYCKKITNPQLIELLNNELNEQ